MKKEITVLTLCALLFALSIPANAQQPKKLPRVGLLISAPSLSLPAHGAHSWLVSRVPDVEYQDGGRAAQNGEPLANRSPAAKRSCRSAGRRCK
jgi:hypothetical protein